MDKDQFLAGVAEVVEMGDGSITLDTRLDNLPGWDSSAVVGMMAFCIEHFGKSFTVEMLDGCQTVDDLHALVASL